MKKSPLEELAYALINDQQINQATKQYYRTLINKVNKQFVQSKKE